uniref:[histone H3]-lysine(4) N-trimethyltransferase n=1 Tax=Denticeps clupeoides TaxID=299321 RepID=A0AAY4B0U6_9TELE
MKTGAIEGVDRFDSPGKGRGLRVTKRFKVGDLVFVSPAYSYVLSANERGFYCEFCFARKEGLAKCGKCKRAFYCNVGCQKGDWAMHKLECSSMCAYGENWCPSETVRLVARIIAKQKTQKERDPSEKLLQVEELEAHLDKMDNEKHEMNETDIAALHHFYSKHLEFPDHNSLLTIFCQVNCNGFTVEDEELSHLGSAVYPDVALMNHSCCPNVLVTYKGHVAEVRAVQQINPGDEVYTSYIDLLYPTEDRNVRLKDAYYFTCDCKECATKAKDKAKMKLRKLSEPPAPEELRKMFLYGRSIIEDFRRLLTMCELSLDKMGAVFDDANVYMLHMMYQSMGVCLALEDWDGAASYGEKIIKPYSTLYPAYSLNVASICLKLGRLYTALDRPSQGLRLLKKALVILEVTHGKDHNYVVDILCHGELNN